jgi:pyruvate,water dikinase
VVVEAVAGLGERLVQGAVTPDRWVLDGRSAAVVQRHGRSALLGDRELSALVELGRRAAGLLGSPQDLEWAVADGRPWLLQSRPITTLLPPPEPAPPPEAGTRVYLSFNFVGQGLTEPLTPMGIALFRALLGRVYGVPGTGEGAGRASWFTVSLGRAYIDVTGMLRYGWFLDRALPLREPVTAAALRRWLDDNPDRLPERPGSGLPFPLRLLAFELWTLPGVVASLLAPERARRRLLARTEARLAALDRRAAALRGSERLAFVERTAPELLLGLLRVQIAAVYTGLLVRALAARLAARWLGRPDAIDPVVRSLPYNPTTEMGLALWQLSRRLQAAGAAVEADDPGVRAFLEVYGHRAVREIDVGVPRWSEDPAYVLELLAAYLGQGGSDDPRQRFVAGLLAAERAVEELVAEARRRRGVARAWVLRRLLRRTRALAGLRERPKFDLVRVLALVRRVLLELGTELVAGGALEHADDVMFCDPEDLRRGGDLRAVAARNRAEYRRELGRRNVPRLMTSDGEAIYGVTGEASADGALVGTAVSPGVYEGPVRVVEHPEGARLEPGEVLVTASTDPAWTPLFLTAGALVMEVGGVMSHGSMVAREYGIPAVVGIPDATRRLCTGQRVRVSGDDGTVRPLTATSSVRGRLERPNGPMLR